MRLLILALTLPLILSVAGPAQAEVLLIERTEAAHHADLPQRGMLMNQVTSRYGMPTRKHATVGGGSAQQPPITRWDYPAFSVYFENDHVVSAVLNRAGALEKGPKPAQSQ